MELTSCISFDSYIKPQQHVNMSEKSKSGISFDSYIKPQLERQIAKTITVVYLLIPTSNHNADDSLPTIDELYIF